MPIARNIEIISVPHGNAPGWVRAAWVGCRFPTASLECGHVPQYVRSVIKEKRSGPLSVAEFQKLSAEERGPQQIAGYSFNQAVALEVLEKHDSKAAAWWKSRGFPNNDPSNNCFRFKREEVAVVDVHTE